MAAKAWLITHPETKMDREGRIHGHLDPPLSTAGREKAKSIAKGLKGKGITKIHSSPRKRAFETAQHISKATGAPVEVQSELEPWKLGSMSGAKTASIKPLLDFFSSRPDRPVPGGESKNDVLKRYGKFMKKVKPGEAIVGHSQHSLAHDYVSKGGDASKVPMVGGKAGEVKRGQSMKKIKGMPITGTNTQMSKKRPLVPDAKNTSANAQTMIAEDPMPFKNKMETPQMPVGTGPRGAVPGQEPKNIYAGKSGNKVGAKALPSMGPIGQRKPIDQSKQIGGKMGYPPPKRKAGVNGQGFPSKRNANFYGE